jgi:hypothetical protein
MMSVSLVLELSRCTRVLTLSDAFLIGAEEKDLACRVVRTCFELHFYMSQRTKNSCQPAQTQRILEPVMRDNTRSKDSILME